MGLVCVGYAAECPHYRPAMREARKSAWCPRRLPPLTHPGWVSPSTPGLGELQQPHPGGIECVCLPCPWLPHCVHLLFRRYVIECPNCGVVYRSRQYWFGNQDPVDTVVRTEIVHVWPGVRSVLQLFTWKSRSCLELRLTRDFGM